MSDAPAPIERAVLAGYLRIIDPPPGFVVPLFRDAEGSGAEGAPSYLIQEIDDQQTIIAFAPFAATGGDVIALDPCEKRVGDVCVVGYELSPGNVVIGTHVDVRRRLAAGINDARWRERPFARWEIADFCGLQAPMIEIRSRVERTAGGSRSLAFFRNVVLAKSCVRARLAGEEGGQSLPAGAFHVVERGGALAIEPGEGLSAEMHAAVSGALAEFAAKQPGLPASAAAGIVHVGVDPRTLPDRAVFRDVDAPWCPEMVVIPKGSFLMGSPASDPDAQPDEKPQHRVTIGSRFAIGRYPVTVGEYRKFVEATDHRHEGGMSVYTGYWKVDASKSWQDPGFAQTDRNPVVGVNWRDAVAYCEWLAKKTGRPYRLPSEAEWEYACRAGTTTRYSWGDAINEKYANFGGKVGKSTEVGAYPPNPWGLYDMHGNVWEWVEDVGHDSYQGAPTDGAAWTEKKGKYSSSIRVNRGGSWYDYESDLRSPARLEALSVNRNNLQGFRVARTLS